MENNILSIKNLSFYFENKQDNDEDWKKILSNVNININKGEIIGLVGASGCGKTTLGKLIVDYFGLNNIKYKMEGEIRYRDKDLDLSIPSSEYTKIPISPIQMVFQDPRTSLNMKMPVYDQLKESVVLKYRKDGTKPHDLDAEIRDLAFKMKLSEKHLKYLPTDMSGGQRRRFGLAKIMAMRPQLIIADEPVASLDVSIKEQIMDVIFDLNRDYQITLIIISHDISLLMKRADKICVIHEKELVDCWDPSEEPTNEATKKLVSHSNYVNQLLSDE